jgi:DNA repair exonuclease SbcCD ATPase subunit
MANAKEILTKIHQQTKLERHKKQTKLEANKTQKIKLATYENVVNQLNEQRDESADYLREISEYVGQATSLASQLNDLYSFVESDLNALQEIGFVLDDVGIEKPGDLLDALEYAEKFLNQDFRTLLNNLEAAEQIINGIDI